MSTTAFQSLKPGDEVEMTRGRLKGARAVVRHTANDGTKYAVVRLELVRSGYTLNARAAAVRIPVEQKG